MDKIIITVDLGHFKAYRVSQAPMESKRITLVKELDYMDGRSRLGETLSDSAGRFGTGGGKKGAAKGYGEPHNLTTETKKKVIRQIAKDISTTISEEKCEIWYLAAGKKINNQLVGNLDAAAKAMLTKNVTADLIKTDKSEILDYFRSE